MQLEVRQQLQTVRGFQLNAAILRVPHLLEQPPWHAATKRVADPQLLDAVLAAWNRWIADFCRDSGGRLVPIAHLSLLGPQGAADELERAVADAVRVFLAAHARR